MNYKYITSTIDDENGHYEWQWRYSVVGSTIMIEDLTDPKSYKNSSTRKSSSNN